MPAATPSMTASGGAAVTAAKRLLPGESHWIMQVVHLLLGLSAMPLAGVLPVLVERRRGHAALVGRAAATASDHGAFERGTP